MISFQVAIKISFVHFGACQEKSLFQRREDSVEANDLEFPCNVVER